MRFCILNLYLVAWLSSRTDSNDISVDSFGFSKRTILTSVNNDISSLNLYTFLFLLFCSAVLARIFTTMLNRNGESKHHCFVADMRGKAYSTLLLSIDFDVDSFADTFWQTKKIIFYFVCYILSSSDIEAYHMYLFK